jgi:DNA primase
MMIPVRDEMGRTIAFSGRVLRKDQVGGKYVNSPETVLFNKSRVLFGIDRARHNIADKGCAILCEGQIDAIRCHQAGFTHTVATQGTALTEQHAHLLHRYTDQVVLVLDADKAGQDAALRGALVLLDAGVMVRLVRLPPDEDPDSLLLRENGPARFSELIDGAMSVIEFHVELLREREDVTSEAGTLRAGHALLETIMHAPTDILRDRFIREAATRMNIREQSLRADLRRMRRRTRRPQKAESPAPAEPASVHPPEEVALVELLLHHLEVAPLIETYVTPEDVSDLQCREFVHILIEHQEDGESFRLMDHVDSRDTEAVRFAARLEAHPGRIIGVEIPPARAAQDLILKLRSRRCARERSRLAEKLRVAQGPESTELRRRSMELAHRMSCLRLGWEKALPILEVMRTAE